MFWFRCIFLVSYRFKMELLLDEIKLFTTDEKIISLVIEKLRECGCCKRCILRFICIKDAQTYRVVDDQRIETLLGLDSDVSARARTASSEELISNGSQNGLLANAGAEPDDGVTQSKELGVCTACLGVLQEQYCKQSFLEEIRDMVTKEDFQFSVFFCSLSLPVSLLLREHSLWIILNDLQPSVFTEDYRNNIIPVKDVWKWVNGSSLANILNVPFDQKSSFAISLTFVHTNTEKECSFLYDLKPDIFRKRKNNRHGWDVFNQTNVLKAIQNATIKKFRQFYNCPPKKLLYPCDCDPIKCHQEALFIAGRYNKYSRHLSQTPWFVDGAKKFETSVEELICTPMMQLVKASDKKFSASGREDVDVRMLGTGRPFVVELINPRRVSFTVQQLLTLQMAINDSSPDVQVRDIQVVAKEETSILKEGEEEKIKRYRALCWTKDDVDVERIDALAKQGSVTIHQKTPIRVLHRRTLAVRDRVIHSLSAKKIDDHHFNLFLSTQAGTYVKEFVHGDFGRTVPNLGTVLGTDCDILELDVEAVELDWPKALQPGDSKEAVDP